MKLHILFFGAIREAVNTSDEWIDVPKTLQTIAQLRQWYIDRGEPWAMALAATCAIRCALNQVVCTEDTNLIPNAEIAFFSPVTGG